MSDVETSGEEPEQQGPEGEDALDPHPFLPNRAFETDDPAAALDEAADEVVGDVES